MRTTTRLAKFGAKPAQGGFTLIELLAVVAIMTILMATVTTNIDLMLPGSRLEASARILSSDITTARTSALAQGLPYRIEYDIDRDSYRIATPFRVDGGVATNDDERVYTSWKEFPGDVKIDFITVGTQNWNRGICRIEMRPNGNTVEHVICLKRENTQTVFYFVVQGLTGFVQFHGSDWVPEVVDDSSFP